MSIETINVDLRNTSSFEIGQQYDNMCTVVKFMHLSYDGSLFLKVSISDYENLIPVTGDMFYVAQPLTNYSGACKAQLYAVKNNGEIVWSSHIFTMIIKPSLGNSDSSSYPVDENINNTYVRLLALEENLNKQYEEMSDTTEKCNTLYEQLYSLKTVTEPLMNLYNELDTVNSTIASMNEIVANFKDMDVSNFETRITALETTVESLNSQVTSILNGDSSVMNEIEDATTDVSETTTTDDTTTEDTTATS